MSRLYSLDTDMQTAAILQKEAAAFVDGRVLDVGCGSMPYKRLFPDCEWIGLDARPVGDVKGIMEDMPFEDGWFDTVICTNALQFSPAPQLAFAEFARVLKDDGMLIVVAPNNSDDDEYALWRFPVGGLVHLARTHSLEPVMAAASGSRHEALFDQFLGFDPFGHTSSGLLANFVHDLDKKFPTVSALVAVKRGSGERPDIRDSSLPVLP